MAAGADADQAVDRSMAFFADGLDQFGAGMRIRTAFLCPDAPFELCLQEPVDPAGAQPGKGQPVEKK